MGMWNHNESRFQKIITSSLFQGDVEIRERKVVWNKNQKTKIYLGYPRPPGMTVYNDIYVYIYVYLGTHHKR